MAQLRRKLEPDPARPRALLTEPGVGYRLKEADSWIEVVRDEMLAHRP